MKNVIFVLLALICCSLAIYSQTPYWEPFSIPNEYTINKVIISPNGQIFAGFLGLYRSSDLGLNWEGDATVTYDSINRNLNDIGSIVEKMVVTKNGTLIAGFLNNFKLRSTNNGMTWDTTVHTIWDASQMIVDTNGRIYALSGDMAFYSDDEGITWGQFKLFSGTGWNYTISAIVLDKNNDIIIGSSGYLLRLKWNGVDFDETPYQYTMQKKISAVTVQDSAILIANDSGLFKSYDMGVTCQTCAGFMENETINVLTQSDNGYLWAGTSKHGIYVSKDKGDNWQRLNLPKWLAINDITTQGPLVLAATSGGFYYSSDYGNSWEPRNNNLGYPIGLISFSETGLMYCLTTANLYISQDKGKSLHSINDGLPDDADFDSYIQDLVSDKTGNIFVTSDEFGLFISTDKGKSWIMDTVGTNFKRKIKKNSRGEVFLLEWSNINENFELLKFDSQANPTKIYEINNVQSTPAFYIGGNDELVIKTYDYQNDSLIISSDNGKSWTTHLFKYRLRFNYLNDLLIVGNQIFITSDSLYFTSDFGNTWKVIIDSTIGNNLNSIKYYTGKILLTSDKGVISSDDFGQTWNNISYPINNFSLSNIGTYCIFDDFDETGRLYITTLHGMYRSINPILAVEEKPVISYEPNIFPNPSNDKLSVQFSSGGDFISRTGKSTVEIYNLMGDIVYKNVIQIEYPEMNIDVKSLPAGCYFIRLKCGTNTKCKMFNIVR